MTDQKVIKHQNVLSLRSFELSDYIKELQSKKSLHIITTEEMEWLDEAISERESRKKAKGYHPKLDWREEARKNKEGEEEMNHITEEDVVKLARLYNVDQSDVLESFLCELFNVSEDKLYRILLEE